MHHGLAGAGVREQHIAPGHALLDVAQELDLPKAWPVKLRELPRARPRLLGEAEALEVLETADELESERLGAGGRRQGTFERDASIFARLPLEDRVELAEVRRLDRPLAGPLAVLGRPVAEGARGELLASLPDALAHVLGGDREGPSVVVSAPDDDVDVRVGRVVVVDRDPLEPGPEVGLHGGEEPARVLAKVQPVTFLGREDELPEPPVARLLPASEAVLDHDVLP